MKSYSLKCLEIKYEWETSVKSKNLVKITYWKNSLLEYIKNKTKPYSLKCLEMKYERKTNVIQKLYYPKIDGYVIENDLQRIDKN